MIKEIKIANYKSIVDIGVNLGRFNVLIGENGCGKSNILEGIALAAAASSDRLDFEYFQNRGVRVVEPKLMVSAFSNPKDDSIRILCREENKYQSFYFLSYDSSAKPPRWYNRIDYLDEIHTLGIIKALLRNKKKVYQIIPKIAELRKEICEFERIFDKDLFAVYENTMFKTQRIEDKNLFAQTLDRIIENYEEVSKACPNLYRYVRKEFIEKPILSDYLIYAPEESMLRSFSDYRTYPLGIRGEGLFRYLKEMSQRKDAKKFFKALKDNLAILDWFEGMNIPKSQISNDYTIQIKDQYIGETIKYFDQNSTNEGFLFLLFYTTLFISEDTPKFFAIDNLETSFNPKMCMSASLF